ncbi:hypothetical protein ACELLULO517_07750 [Acidisoma cellulosilytica]|uniref:Uncharacterized protein n=1 Tax=Acidisoma cellulosilyticum TaxID=2802395 RepID=A0A964E2Y5_9PROT|nr:hypothetical protein [Acidisoma cellulosilyticum]MCB8880125.1 hypothetical protein [Acidisoma cellulosilyticum]
MAATHFSGPVQAGTKKDADQTGAANIGSVLLTQTLTLTQNGTTAVTAAFVLPANSQIVGFNVDTVTAWNSGTSDTLTIGTAAAGSQYVGGVSVATAARAAISYTAAELLAMSNIGVNTTVDVTVTPVGTAATAGTTIVTIEYIQAAQ